MDLDPSLPSPCTSVNSAFSYTPLDHQQQQIRLISVEPAADGPIRCQMKHVILTTNRTPEYRALSYVWGPKAQIEEIVVNKQPFTVRRNLYDFLLAFRARLFQYGGCDQFQDEIQWLWIDQICIAQSSILERNHQVGLMAEIYKRATYVYVWLGVSDGETDAGMTAMKVLMREHYHRRVNVDNKNGPCQSQSRAMRHEPASLKKFFDNAYWGRLWIVQEIMLARYIRVMCGETLLSWDELKTFCAFEEANQNQDPCQVVPSQVVWLAQHALSAKEYSYASLLWTFVLSECENPRDRIYGLQGIVKEEDRLTIDYGQSVRSVFAHAFETMIKNFGRRCGQSRCITSYKVDPDALDYDCLAADTIQQVVSAIMRTWAQAWNLSLFDTLIKLGDRMGLKLSKTSSAIHKDSILLDLERKCNQYGNVVQRSRLCDADSQDLAHNGNLAQLLMLTINENLDELRGTLGEFIKQTWQENNVCDLSEDILEVLELMFGRDWIAIDVFGNQQYWRGVPLQTSMTVWTLSTSASKFIPR